MVTPGFIEMLHHAPEHAAAGDRTVVAVDGGRDALERRAILLGFGRHSTEQEGVGSGYG